MTARSPILLGLTDPALSDRFARGLAAHGLPTLAAHEPASLTATWQQERCPVILLDEALGSQLPAEFFQRLHPEGRAQLVWIGSAVPPRPAVACLAQDVAEEELVRACLLAVERGEMLDELARLRRRLSHRAARDLIGHSPALDRLRHEVATLSQTSSAVLIEGERGTGRQLAARIIHDLSDRAYRPFIVIDCAVKTAADLEEELAGTSPENRFEQARGGVLLLHHISELAIAAQAVFLKHFESSCARQSPQEQARLIATTALPLESLVQQGTCDRHLAALFSGAPLLTPSLRSRPEDIAPLCEHILGRIAAREGTVPRRIPLDVLRLLKAYDWPGNVREMEHLLERACALDAGSRLTVEMLQPWLGHDELTDAAADASLSLRAMERKLIETTFARYSGNREQTARVLQIGVRTLCGKLREYGYPPRGGPGSNQSRAEPNAA